MGESRLVIDLKKKRLAEELTKNNPDNNIVSKLKKDIQRHKKWEIRRNRARRNRKKRWEKRNLK
jgi:hypothetical protein